MTESLRGVCPHCKVEIPVEYNPHWDQVPIEENYVMILHPRTEPGTELFCYGSGEYPLESSLKT